MPGLKGGLSNQISALGKPNWPECHWSKQTGAIFCKPEVQAQKLCTTDLQQQLKTVPLKILDSYSYQNRLLKGNFFWAPKISDKAAKMPFFFLFLFFLIKLALNFFFKVHLRPNEEFFQISQTIF